MLLVLERLTSVIFVTIFVSYYPVQLPFQKGFAVFINTEQKKNINPGFFPTLLTLIPDSLEKGVA